MVLAGRAVVQVSQVEDVSLMRQGMGAVTQAVGCESLQSRFPLLSGGQQQSALL